MKVASIFTGVGGFELGMANKRFEVILHAEHDPSKKQQPASAVLKHKFPKIPNLGRLEDIFWEDQPDFDILAGGAPCQAFSEAGKRRGFQDLRGTMFFEYARALKEKQPKYFVFENVKGLLTHDNSDTIRTMFRTFKELGYNFDFELLRASNFGPAQNRDRIFIVGVRSDCLQETYSKFKGGGVGGLEPCSSTNPETKLEHYELSKHSFGEAGGRKVRFRSTRHYDNAKGWCGPWELSNDEDTEEENEVLAYSKSTRSSHIDHRIRRDGTANTLNTGDGCRTQSSANFVYNHGDESLRKLTPLECERIQGWPDNWTKYGEFDGQVVELSDRIRYKLIGNGVVPQVVHAVMENVLV